MWRNPKFRTEADDDPAQAPAPPAETGRRLAHLDRAKKDGPDEALRIHLDSYENHAYISCRLWTHDARSGSWWPTKRGVTVRISEIDEVISALRSGKAIAERESGRTFKTKPLKEGPRRPKAMDACQGEGATLPEPKADGFDDAF
jgi:hypothetical protein